MFKYTPHFIPSAIYMVGCGGTGSRLVPMMTQLVKTVLKEFNPLGWKDELPIFLIDDDVVEEKNLKRQNFIAQDVGRSKAVVLAERYSRGMGIPIHPIIRRIMGNDRLEDIPVPSMQGPHPTANIILIMAVDSPQARREVLSCFFRRSNSNQGIFIIDAGNEDNFGQVKFFTNSFLHNPGYSSDVDKAVKNMLGALPKMVPEPKSVSYIPYSKKYYDNLGTTSAEKSCADLDQTLAINAMMATIMCGILQNFLYIKPFTYNQINYNLNGSVSTVYNTAQFWFSREMVNDYNDSNNLRGRAEGFEVSQFVNTPANGNEYAGYILHVEASLKKMGLSLNRKTGDVEPQALNKISDAQELKSPKKKTKIAIQNPEIEIG